MRDYEDIVDWLKKNEGGTITASVRSLQVNVSNNIQIKSYKFNQSEVDIKIYNGKQNLVLSPYKIKDIQYDLSSGYYLIHYEIGLDVTIGIVA